MAVAPATPPRPSPLARDLTESARRAEALRVLDERTAHKPATPIPPTASTSGQAAPSASSRSDRGETRAYAPPAAPIVVTRERERERDPVVIHHHYRSPPPPVHSSPVGGAVAGAMGGAMAGSAMANSGEPAVEAPSAVRSDAWMGQTDASSVAPATSEKGSFAWVYAFVILALVCGFFLMSRRFRRPQRRVTARRANYTL